MPSNTTSTLKTMDQGVVLNFNLFFKKNIFVKTVAGIDSDSSDGSKQSKLKTFWKGFTILDVTKKICNSWEEVIISTLTEAWKKLIPILMDDFNRFKTSVEQVTRDVVKIARQLEWKVEPEDMTELLQPHDMTLTDEELLLMHEQRNWCLEWKRSPGEDAWRLLKWQQRI